MHVIVYCKHWNYYYFMYLCIVFALFAFYLFIFNKHDFSNYDFDFFEGFESTQLAHQVQQERKPSEKNHGWNVRCQTRLSGLSATPRTGWSQYVFTQTWTYVWKPNKHTTTTCFCQNINPFNKTDLRCWFRSKSISQTGFLSSSNLSHLPGQYLQHVQKLTREQHWISTCKLARKNTQVCGMRTMQPFLNNLFLLDRGGSKKNGGHKTIPKRTKIEGSLTFHNLFSNLRSEVSTTPRAGPDSDGLVRTNRTNPSESRWVSIV